MATHDVLTVKGLGAAAVIKNNKSFNGVNELLAKLKDFFPDELTFTPQLSGSVSEGTKAGDPNEFDFLCTLQIKDNDGECVAEFECEDFDKSRTGTKQNFKCLICPDKCERYAGELEHSDNRDEYRRLDYVKLCTDFIKYLTDAIEKLKKTRLPNNLYIFRQVHVNNLIRTLHLKWRGDEFKDLSITVDIVPTLNISQEAWLNNEHESINVSIKKILGVKYLGNVMAVGKPAGFDDMKYHMRLTFSDIETKLISSVPLYCRLAYILLKSFRHPAICKQQTQSDEQFKTEDDIPSYTMKTCLMFVLEDEGLIPQEAVEREDEEVILYEASDRAEELMPADGNEEGEDTIVTNVHSSDDWNPKKTNVGNLSDVCITNEALAAYIQEHRSEIIDIAAKIIHRIKDYITTLGGVPNFFNRTYDILFGYSLVGDYNLEKLKVDGPRKKRKERILRFCNFVKESLKSGQVLIDLSVLEAQSGRCTYDGPI